MPRKPKDYSKTVIYAIENADKTMRYIGSTTNIVQRRAEHKYSANCPNSHHYDISLYRTIRQNGGWDKWTMLPIECFPCNNKNEALIRELYWVKNSNSNLNKVDPTIPEDERSSYGALRTKCACGVEFFTKNKGKHESSQFHQNYLSSSSESSNCSSN